MAALDENVTAGPDACSAYGDSAMEDFGDARDGSEDYCTAWACR